MESFETLLGKKTAEISRYISFHERYTEAQSLVQKNKIMIEVLAQALIKALRKNALAFEVYMQIINVIKHTITKGSSSSKVINSETLLPLAQNPEFGKKFQYVRERVIEIIAFHKLMIDILSQMTEPERTLLTALDPTMMEVTTVFCRLIAEDPARVPKTAEAVNVIGRIDEMIVQILETP